MKCETCEGRGFIEYEHGLVMVECEVCKGTGEMLDVLTEEVLQKAIDMSSPEPLNIEDKGSLGQDSYIPPEAVETIEIPKELKEAPDDDSGGSRDRPDNQPVGSKDTGKHKQPRKPKARKKTTKRPS